MKLQDILKLVENNAAHTSVTNSMVSSTSGTTSGAVAEFSPILKQRKDDMKDRVGFAQYATAEKCPGCEIIKRDGWHEVGGAKASKEGKELVCTMCGKSHKKGKK